MTRAGRTHAAIIGVMAFPVLAFFVFAVANASRLGFWYDESVQFWMSMGLDSFEHPFTPPKGLAFINFENARGNLDPGGFSLLLGLWFKIATSPEWARALPLIFHALGMAGLAGLGWLLRRNWAFAAFCSLVPAAFPLLLHEASEMRAYSMEFAGIAIGCTLLTRLATRPSISAAITSALVIGFFLTSRYAYVLFAASASIALAVVLLTAPAEDLRRNTRILLTYALTLFAIGILILASMVLPQYELRISYNNGAMLDYLKGTTAAGLRLPDLVAAACSNLLSPSGVPLTMAAAAAFLTWKKRTLLSPAFFFFSLLALTALVLTMAVWPWHPWDIQTKWSLWLQCLSAIAVIHFASLLMDRIRTGVATPLLLAAALVLGLRMSFYRSVEDVNIHATQAFLEAIRPAAGSVSVEYGVYPTFRQLYEYGPFAGSSLYPNSFRLPHWQAPVPLVTADTDWLVTGETLAAAQKRYPDYLISAEPELPRNIFSVKPRTD
jgi:hypothetical protein